ncbi:MAG: hypothetical protein OXG81_10230 [Acidobacteria bacterium]|nr:hypothetical protein [Acidobacteriota bacterium]
MRNLVLVAVLSLLLAPAATGQEPLDRSSEDADTRSAVSEQASDHSATKMVFHDRFEVEIKIRNRMARALDADLPGDSAAVFYFYSADNPEMLVKVLDGCENNGHWWVFAASATDQRFDLQVFDTHENHHKVYFHMGGGPARTLTDTAAFGCE